MTDDTPPKLDLSSIYGSFPEQYEIPFQILDPWMKVPSSEYLDIRLTKQDVERLFFGLMKSGQAQDAHHACLIHWSNGQLDDANKSMHQSKRLLIESQNSLKQFFTAIFAAATQGRRDAGE